MSLLYFALIYVMQIVFELLIYIKVINFLEFYMNQLHFVGFLLFVELIFNKLLNIINYKMLFQISKGQDVLGITQENYFN